jgi:DNA invertase Pin-like site-specific DNA recombinase
MVKPTRGSGRTVKRAIALLRVSTKGQMKTDYNPEGISLPAQRQTIKGKAKELGAVIVDEYLEPGNTGTTMAKRPVFRQMMERIRTQGDVDYIITYERERRGAPGVATARRALRLRHGEHQRRYGRG